MARTPDDGRGEAFRRWFRGLPRTTRRVVMAGVVIGWLVLWYVALFAVRRAIGDDDVGWAEPLFSMIGPLVGVALALWLRRRAMGSFGRVWDLDRAVRRRRLPDDADPAEWEPLLEKGDSFQRGARKFALGSTVITGVLLMIGLAWAGFGWIAVLVAAAICGVAVALVEFGGKRRSQRIELLQEQLRSLPDSGPSRRP